MQHHHQHRKNAGSEFLAHCYAIFLCSSSKKSSWATNYWVPRTQQALAISTAKRRRTGDSTNTLGSKSTTPNKQTVTGTGEHWVSMRKYKSGRLSAWVSLLFYSQAKNSFNPSNVWLYSTKELKVGHGFWLTIGKSIPSLCFMKKSYFLWLSTSVVDGCMFHTWVWNIRLQQLLIDWSEGSNSDCTSSNWNVKAWKIAQYHSLPTSFDRALPLDSKLPNSPQPLILQKGFL